VRHFGTKLGTPKPAVFALHLPGAGAAREGPRLKQRTNPRKKLAQEVIRPVKDKEVMTPFEANEFLVWC
jgi:hypothetical protein